MTINVKQAPRRELSFETLDDILAEAEAIAAGPHHTTGNHTAGELFYHVAVPMKGAVEGFGFAVPLPMRLFGRTLKLLGKAAAPFNPGINPPKSVLQHFWPPEPITTQQGLDTLRAAIDAARAPGSMTHPSPLFGHLSHDEHVVLNCRHAELHFSFIHPGDGQA